MPNPETPIRTYRLKNGISLDALAARVGVSSASLSRIERGLQFPGRGVMARIVTETGVSADEIVGVAPSLSEDQKGADHVS